MDPDVRFAVAKKIVERCADFGIPAHDVVVDPLVMPIGALGQAGKAAFHLIRRLRMELKVNTTCGASNISFGLPNRHGLNSSFLAMAIGAGMTSAITNPLHLEEMIGVMGGDVLMGQDAHCAAWIRKFREPAAEGEGAGAGGRRGRENRRRGGGGGTPSGGTEGVQAAAEPTAQVVNG
jgi:5-methyltetrahydrofolate--homocysteine methyltransferase